MKMTLPKVGDKVVVADPVWFDGGEVPTGKTAIISLVELDPDDDQWIIELNFQQKIEGLEGFGGPDNRFRFYPQCGTEWHPNGFEMNTLAQFHHHCQFIHDDVSRELREV